MGSGVMDMTAGSAVIKTRDDVNNMMKEMKQEADRVKQE